MLSRNVLETRVGTFCLLPAANASKDDSRIKVHRESTMDLAILQVKSHRHGDFDATLETYECLNTQDYSRLKLHSESVAAITPDPWTRMLRQMRAHAGRIYINTTYALRNQMISVVNVYGNTKFSLHAKVDSGARVEIEKVPKYEWCGLPL